MSIYGFTGMQASEIKALLEGELPGATVIAQGEGCSFELTVIAKEFESASTLARQKKVYACLGPFIADGSIHAVSMRTFTPMEWEQKTNH